MIVIVYYLGVGNSISIAKYKNVKTFQIHQDEITLEWTQMIKPETIKYHNLHRIEIIPEEL